MRSSIVVHSSDSIRRYSSVVLCRAPVSAILLPLDIPHFELTSVKKSVCNCFILALYSNLSFPAKISLYAKRPSFIGRSVQCTCGFNSSRCTMKAAMFCLRICHIRTNRHLSPSLRFQVYGRYGNCPPPSRSPQAVCRKRVRASVVGNRRK